MTGFQNTFKKQIILLCFLGKPQQHLIIGGLFFNLVKQERTVWGHVSELTTTNLFVLSTTSTNHNTHLKITVYK